MSPSWQAPPSSCAFTRVLRRIILLYPWWRVRRLISTTTVFCILSLTTVPTTVWRRLRSAGGVASILRSSLPGRGRRRRRSRGGALGRLDPGDVAAELPDPHGILQLRRGLAEPQSEEFVGQFGLLLVQFLPGQVLQLAVLHPPVTPNAFREMKRVAMGSFMAARRMASFASVSEIPSISYRMRP